LYSDSEEKSCAFDAHKVEKNTCMWYAERELMEIRTLHSSPLAGLPTTSEMRWSRGFGRVLPTSRIRRARIIACRIKKQYFGIPFEPQARRGGAHSRILLGVALPHTPKSPRVAERLRGFAAKNLIFFANNFVFEV